MNERLKNEKSPTRSGEELVPNEENVVDETEFCGHYESDPCVIVELQEILSSCRDVESNKQIRFMMYRDSMRFIIGSGLGKGARKKLPVCKQGKIHSMIPYVTYTGFMKSNNNKE